VDLWSLQRPGAAAVSKADDEDQQRAFDEDENRAGDPEEQPVDVRDLGRLRRIRAAR